MALRNSALSKISTVRKNIIFTFLNGIEIRLPLSELECLKTEVDEKSDPINKITTITLEFRTPHTIFSPRFLDPTNLGRKK